MQFVYFRDLEKIMPAITIETSIHKWGNGLAVRINKSVAKAAGVAEGSQVRISAQAGRIVIEKSARRPSLEEMLAGFDPQRHGGEVMAFKPVGVEVV